MAIYLYYVVKQEQYKVFPYDTENSFSVSYGIFIIPPKEEISIVPCKMAVKLPYRSMLSILNLFFESWEKKEKEWIEEKKKERRKMTDLCALG